MDCKIPTNKNEQHERDLWECHYNSLLKKRMTEEYAIMILEMCKGYLSSRRFTSLSRDQKHDIIQNIFLRKIMNNWKKYDQEKGRLFTYITMMIQSQTLTELSEMKKRSEKDAILRDESTDLNDEYLEGDE